VQFLQIFVFGHGDEIDSPPKSPHKGDLWIAVNLVAGF
jgi:hypothetical protein